MFQVYKYCTVQYDNEIYNCNDVKNRANLSQTFPLFAYVHVI